MPCSDVATLVSRLDEAVAAADAEGCCRAVKAVLEGAFDSGEELLPAWALVPCEEKYARRLIHRDPEGRYTVVAMVWAPGQGTALHDHAGHWCVECVYRGRIKVVSYDLEGSDTDVPVRFRPEREVYAGVGEAGALIPPFEYHTIENVEDEPAVTVHVYAEELKWCHVFLPVEGGYERVRRELAYTA